MSLKNLFLVIGLVVTTIASYADQPAKPPKLLIPPEEALIEDSWILKNYREIVVENTPDQYEEYSNCMRGGNVGCGAWLGRFLVERAYAGLSTQFSDPEIVYILRSGLCAKDTVNDRSKKEDQFDCSLADSEASLYLSAVYREGILGMPKDRQLAQCWDMRMTEECTEWELRKYGPSVFGVKPKGVN